MAVASVASAATTEKLRIEAVINPLGLDVPKPRLSWIVQSDERNAAQTAYRVLVASSEKELADDHGDLWDSGKVASDESAHIEYAGTPLMSREGCWWKVRIWDQHGAASTWSTPAHWEMGLLKPEDWQAKWIQAPIIPKPQAGQPSVDIRQAFYEAVDGSASKDVTAIVAGMLRDNQLQVTVSNEILGGDPAPGHVKQLRLECNVGGSKSEVITPESETCTIPSSGWALPYLRKDFRIGKKIVTARLYVTALGLYEMQLNGRRVGDHIFAPDWTDYNKRIRYQVYDITSLLKVGDNTLGAQVGNGWYAGHIGNGGFQAWGKVPALYAQLEVTYGDGTMDRIVTDNSWKTHAGPILTSDFMRGENYDARQEIVGWSSPGLTVDDWGNASERSESVRPFDGQVEQPLRQTGTLTPKSMNEPTPGHWTFDLGQNMVGFVRLKVNAPAGTKVILRHAEMLNSDGTVYTMNLRGAPSIDTYICKGGGVETWQPRFTFHGFRYVELSGLPSKPASDAVTGIVAGTDIPAAGRFACSNPEVNQLQSNIQWGMRGNYLSVPTDCPQRDERMGWMGDAQIFCRTAAYNGDVEAFFTKWLVDVDDAQFPDGRFTDVSPIPPPPPGGQLYGGNGVPAWADAGVICPWTIYLMYGDKRILQDHLPAMTRWVDWCLAHSTNLIRDRDRGNDYGDWLAQGEDTQRDLIGTAFFAYSTSLVAKAYKVVGDDANADKYGQLFEKIKAAFNQKYVQPDGHILNCSQTAYSLALHFNLLPDELRPKAAQWLADDVAQHSNHLTTGFVGVSHLLPSLTMEGKVEAAYSVFLQDTFPSWLFSVKHGATTIWERWDGWTPERGFQDPGMNSFNHYSLGSCGQWMFDSVAGIGLDVEQPGFKHILISPRPGGNLTSAEGSFNSTYGTISSQWTLENGKFSLKITIPANTTATVTLPTTKVASVHENDIEALTDLGSLVTANNDGFAQCKVGAGNYHFTCEVP